jgi:hypothetical protein
LKESNSFSEGFPCLLDAARLLFERGSMKSTDPASAALLKALQREGIRIGVLTSRGPQIQAVTLRELALADFNFLSSSPPDWFAAESESHQPVRIGIASKALFRVVASTARKLPSAAPKFGRAMGSSDVLPQLHQP